MKYFFLFLIISGISLASYAQTVDKTKLDQYLDALEKNDKFMGSIALSQKGEIIYSRTIGLADVEHNKKATPSSKYRVGSVTKSFTAVLTLMAVEENKLALDQVIEKFFPSLANADKITVRHLLQHRSGVHDFTKDTDYPSWLAQPQTRAQMLEKIQSSGPDFSPDSRGEYSNSNYVLLTFILEDVYQQPYSTLLNEKIAKPLRLQSTYIGSKINPSEDEAFSYQLGGKWMKETETDMSIPVGAGALVSTPSDLLTFAHGLFSGKLISAASLEEMKTPKEGYGLGLFAVPFNEKRGYGHTGGIDGFTSAYFYFPEGDVGFALTSNGSTFSNNDIAIAALSSVFGGEFEIPEFLTYDISEKELDVLLGTYASAEIPLKLTFVREGKSMIAQATGQPPLTLQSESPIRFTSAKHGVVLTFDTDAKTVTLDQAGMKLVFKRE